MRNAKVLFICIVVLAVCVAHADVEELRAKIGERESQIAALEREIEGYQKELDTVGAQANTLKNAIAALDLTRRKLLAEIRSTEGQIAAAVLRIDALTEDISGQSVRIHKGTGALGKALRLLAASEREPLVSTMLAGGGLSGAWREADALYLVQARLSARVNEIKELKVETEGARDLVDAERRRLASLKEELSDRKKIADANRREQQALLDATKNKEANYQKLLDERLARRAAFEQELLEFEMALQFELDPSRLPSVGAGVLKWPLDNVKITQYFGNTPFAQSGAYNGKGHNGVDFRASVGTPIKAALGGMVRGVGDTDTVCRNASYGKWILIEHGNGLSTLYAHLSLIRVDVGQSVNTGEVVGYSGNTGYATGPHLHFAVFATQGVEIGTLRSRVCGRDYTMPLANPSAYLNPLVYL